MDCPTPSLKIVNQTGSSTITTPRNDTRAAATSGVVEVVHARAPAATILLIERDDNSSFASGEAAVNYARTQPGVSVVSMSYGSAEANDFTSLQQEQATDSDYTTPAGHIGVTIVASSGDGKTVEYPSASPNVLTTVRQRLTTDSGGDPSGRAAPRRERHSRPEGSAGSSLCRPTRIMRTRAPQNVECPTFPSTGSTTRTLCLGIRW